MFVFSLNFTTNWTEYLVWACSRPFRTAEKAMATARKWQTRLSNNRFAGAVASTIVDLQEAQSQYLAIITIVGLVAYAGNELPGFGKAHTLRAWSTNSRLLDEMVSSSIYPITSVQIALHKTRNRWWYTLLWVVFTWTMAYAIALSGYATGEQIDKRFKQDSGLSSCGQNAGPKIYCLSYGISDEGFAYNGLTLPSEGILGRKFTYWTINGIVPFLLLDWITKGVLPLFFSKERLMRHRSYQVSTAVTSQPTLTALELFTIGLGTYNLATFVMFRNALGDTYGKGESGSVFGGWSYGQFVALFVWMPILGKFLSLLIGKSQRLPFSSGIRLTHWFRGHCSSCAEANELLCQCHSGTRSRANKPGRCS